MQTEVIQPAVTKTIVSAPTYAEKTPNQRTAPEMAVAATRPRKTGLTRRTPRSEGSGLRRRAASGRGPAGDRALSVLPRCDGCDRLLCWRSDSPGRKSLAPV